MESTQIKDFQTVVLDSETKGLLLDFDNCLYLYEPCHHFALLSVKNAMENKKKKIDNFFELYKKAQSLIKARTPNQASSHSRILYFQAIFEFLGKGSSPKKSLAMEKLYWRKFMEKMSFVRGVKSFLLDCKKKGIKVTIVSDLTTSIQFEKLVKLEIDHLIDFVVTSEEAGVEKPNKKIFLLALKKMGLKSNEVVMIGDSFERDILGAQKLGIKTLQIVHE